MSAVATVQPVARFGALLPVVAVSVFMLVVGAVIQASGDTLGFDFLAYHQAAQRLLNGEALYDPTVQETGGFGLFYYPPTFALPLVPLGLVDASTAIWIWIGILAAAFLGAIALMPVAPRVRWTVLLLGGLMWPVAYTFKLGQVGPLLMLAFAVGWRWLDDPLRVGGSAAAGALAKLQPGLVLVWAALTGRWRATAVGIAVGVIAGLVTTVVVGIGAWFDYLALLRNVSDPITTPHNFTPGAVVYQLGASEAVAATVQLVASIGVVGAVILGARRATAAASFLVAVIASQLLSPVLWDHYAVILLLPVAWLLQRGHWWAALVPLSTSVLLVGWTPAWLYPVLFFLVLVLVLAIGMKSWVPAGPLTPAR